MVVRKLVCGGSWAALVLAAASCGSVDGGTGADADVDGAPVIDADPNAPDADPNAPDADPTAPDAAPPGPECGGPTGAICSAGAYCDWTPDSCGLSGETGACAPRPTGPCPELYYPVCGCDNMTYPNECDANAFGHDIIHTGVCM